MEIVQSFSRSLMPILLCFLFLDDGIESKTQNQTMFLRRDEFDSDECPRRIPALIPSLFSSISPVINFALPGQIIDELPSRVKKLQTWKAYPKRKTVRKVLLYTNFRLIDRYADGDWIGCWCLQMEPHHYHQLQHYQKFNHFPGSKTENTRKDVFWRNVHRFRSIHGQNELSFVPLTFVLPDDMAEFKTYWDKHQQKSMWIYKPYGSSGGKDVNVISRWDQVPTGNFIIQRYISRPYLIDGHKFDLRLYVYVSSLDPLRMYIYENGVARFASKAYSLAVENQEDTMMHITNWGKNKNNSRPEINEIEMPNIAKYGIRWNLDMLWSYLQSKGIDTRILWDKIKDMIIMQFLSAESILYRLMKANVRNPQSCHELFGYDIILDHKLNPWMLEVNPNPSMDAHTRSEIFKVKLARDVLNLGGIRMTKMQSLTPMSFHTRQFDFSDRPDEKGQTQFKSMSNFTQYKQRKPYHFANRASDDEVETKILDVLTPADVRVLLETEDEYHRRGSFQRIFPSPTSHKYLKYFEERRYNNLLLDAWTRKYHDDPKLGLQLLEALSKRKLHLES